jgi:hypothetical protein
MISVVEGPAEDEPVFSFLARIAARVVIPNRRRFAEYLFGTFNPSVHMDFPNGLEALVDSVGRRIGLTVEDLIWKHTMLPAIAPFMEPDRVKKLVSAMHSNDQFPSKQIMWRRDHAADGKRRLRFCVLCQKADRKQHAFTWWRRTPQVPGVICCPEHAIALVNSQFVFGETWKVDYPPADSSRCCKFQSRTGHAGCSTRSWRSVAPSESAALPWSQRSEVALRRTP